MFSRPCAVLGVTTLTFSDERPTAMRTFYQAMMVSVCWLRSLVTSITPMFAS